MFVRKVIITFYNDFWIAVLLVTELVKDYLLNYARSLVFTTSLTFANIVAINCSFDMLEDGTAEVVGYQ